MGSFFSNLHIRKRDNLQISEIKAWAVGEMQKRGFELVPDEEHSDGGLGIFVPTDGCWISVCSDLIEFSTAEDTRAVLVPLSEALNTDVLGSACFDSDFLFLNWVNEAAKDDAWMNVGKMPGMPCPRRTVMGPWKRLVSDFDALKAARKEEYVFAEEFWEPFGKLIGLPMEQGCISEESLNELPGQVVRLYFALPAGEEKPELPKLELPSFDLVPCRDDQNTAIFALNCGGKSRGLRVELTAGCQEEEVTFRDVLLEYNLSKHPRTCRPIQLTGEKRPDGTWVYAWEDAHFPIPPKVREGLTYYKAMEQAFGREFGVRFTSQGNRRKFLDITITFIPLSNPDQGRCSWCVWHLDGSKEAFLDRHNDGCKGLWEKSRIDPEDIDW